MPVPSIEQPLTFHPIFMERVWGGRRLESAYGKCLPAGLPIGESWEIVDRPEAQSVVSFGPLAGKTLHELWSDLRHEIFGILPNTERFPLLIKLLDAQQKLSLQVHPPGDVATELDGESKTEFWYIAQADSDAELCVGLKRGSSKAEFAAALENGSVAEIIYRVAVKSGDAMFVPSGRMHAIGAGNLIVEIQENSDTTYRVFDWNRTDAEGEPRALHIEQSLRSIDFDDYEPQLVKAKGESLVRHPLFAVEKWKLPVGRVISPPGTFAILVCLTGECRCAETIIHPGHFLLLPACLECRKVEPGAPDTSLLLITIPQP